MKHPKKWFGVRHIRAGILYGRIELAAAYFRLIGMDFVGDNLRKDPFIGMIWRGED